jgi:hypothetical protein
VPLRRAREKRKQLSQVRHEHGVDRPRQFCACDVLPVAGVFVQSALEVAQAGLHGRFVVFGH